MNDVKYLLRKGIAVEYNEREIRNQCRRNVEGDGIMCLE